MSEPQQITKLLDAIRVGDRDAERALADATYADLRAIAGDLMRRERPGHTLQPTALVHEAWLRLVASGGLATARDRAYFLGAAARAMRRVLVEHARARQADKRGGGRARVALDDKMGKCDDTLLEFDGRDVAILDLEAALQELSALNARHGELVMLRFFGGLHMAEAAETLGVSLTTAESDLRMARAWLKARLGA